MAHKATTHKAKKAKAATHHPVKSKKVRKAAHAAKAHVAAKHAARIKKVHVVTPRHVVVQADRYKLIGNIGIKAVK